MRLAQQREVEVDLALRPQLYQALYEDIVREAELRKKHQHHINNSSSSIFLEHTHKEKCSRTSRLPLARADSGLLTGRRGEADQEQKDKKEGGKESEEEN